MKKNDRLTDWEENEKTDRNNDGIDDAIEPPIPSIAAGRQQLERRIENNPNTSPVLSGGDIDARWEAADSTGDEAVAGSMPTPGQNDVTDIGTAMGVTYADDEELKAGEKERERDKKRWELDPASSEDYKDRLRADNE